jgi:orotidine-5'-phosphate decarboxylase
MHNSAPLILALDVDSGTEALATVAELKDVISVFKVGKQLFTQEGPELVRAIRRQGADVFLDLKFHDIPQTVKKAVKAAAALDVRFLTIHASGGSEMMQAAVEGAQGTRLQILAVTVLTSLDDDALREIGFDHSAAGQVLHLAKMANRAGVPGLICSPQEIALIRREIAAPMILVTPGIRSATDAVGDQKRTMSAPDAIKAGADFLVVGRPIMQAPDRKAAALELMRQISEVKE